MSGHFIKLFPWVFPYLFLANLKAQPIQVLEVPFCNQAIVVDGDVSEWEMKPVAKFSGTTSNNSDANHCEAYLAWDEQNLYLAAKVYDRYLVGLEPSNNPKRIHYNDSFEFYIDTKNDSHDTLDFNDYQFLFDLHGAFAIFTSDPLDSALKYRVPKETGLANLVIKPKARLAGTANYTTDTDAYYSVECLIPWEGIGVTPYKGLRFKADFCMNDNDTVVDFKMLQPGPISRYSSTSYLGYHDFGYPSKWISLKLSGSATIFKQLNARYSKDWLLFLFFSIGCASLAIFAFLLKLKRPAQPVRDDAHDKQLVDFISHTSSNQGQLLQNHEFFDKAKDFVMDHLHEVVTIERLSNELGCGIRQTQRMFKAGLQTTPTAFILAIKLEHAAKLLTTTPKNMAEVAYAIGFADPSYFSRAFKRYFGQSPSEYQRTKAKV